MTATSLVSVFDDVRIIKRDILTAAATTWSSPTLQGNTDGGYILRGRLINATAQSSDISLLINSVGSNLVKSRLYYIGSSTTVASDVNLTALGASVWLDFWFTIPDARSGNGPRLVTGWITPYTATAISYTAHMSWLMKTADSNVEITSIQLSGAIASSLGIGSKIILERTF